MFTTIAKLRASSADQSRVTSVRNALIKRIATWTEDLPFPILFIVISNTVADFNWVNNDTSLHVTPKGLTAAAIGKLRQLLPEDYTFGLNRAQASEYLAKMAPAMPAVLQKVGFFSVPGYDLLTSAKPPAKAVQQVVAKTPAPKVTKPKLVIKKAPAKKTANVVMVAEGVNVSLESLGVQARKTSPSKSVGGTTQVKHLPIPSVIKQIKDLVKDHPKIRLTEGAKVPLVPGTYLLTLNVK